MFNTYYSYTKGRDRVELSARDETNGGIDLLVIKLASNPNSGTAAVEGVHLTIQEQDDLIAGILERRGLCLARLLPTGYPPISAGGTEQSKIHPANPIKKQ